MALQHNINVNTPITTNVDIVFMRPGYVHSLFPNLQENVFYSHVMRHIPHIRHSMLDRKQYWVRYLLCQGRVDDVLNELVFITQNHIPNIHITGFINCHYNDFDGDTILHHAVKWCPDVRLIHQLLQYGANANVVNSHGFYPEENIHRTGWFNPFARLLNMPILFVQEEDGIRLWGLRNDDDFNAVIFMIQELVGERQQTQVAVTNEGGGQIRNETVGVEDEDNENDEDAYDTLTTLNNPNMNVNDIEFMVAEANMIVNNHM